MVVNHKATLFCRRRFQRGSYFFIYLNRRFRSPAVAGSLHAPAKILAAPHARGSKIPLACASHLPDKLRFIDRNV